MIEEKAKEVSSLAHLLRALNLRVAGGNYANMKKTLQRYNIDCSHWTGQGWSKDQQLKDWSAYNDIKSVRRNLIRERSHKCEECDLSEWRSFPITLEIHHIDGDRTNNSLSNLQLLCCNCHALTDFWRNKKMVSTVGPAPTLNTV